MLSGIPVIGVVFKWLGGLICWGLSQPPDAVIAVGKATCTAIFGGCQ